MGQIQSIEELISFLIRRRFLIGLVAVVGIILSVVLAKMKPDVYETAAAIQVQSAQVAGDGGAAGSGSALLMQSIEQRLTTRDNMLAVIDRHGVFDGLALTPDQKVAALRGSVTFQPVAAAGNQTFGMPSAISAIIIGVRLDDPEKAARVANDFAQGILDMSSSGAADRARDTLAFFQQDLSRVEGEIAALEGQIASYKNANAAALPALVDARRDEMVSVEDDLREIGQQLVALVDEQSRLEGLATLRATERRRLEDISRQIAVLEGQSTALTTRKAEIEAALTTTPEVERQLAAFDRQLTQLQEQYQVLTRRMAEAQTGQRLAETQQGERFSLLERAITPLYPTGSGGKKIAVLGAIASILAGLGLAFVLDLVHPVVRSARQMERQLGLIPVVAIPELSLPAANRRGKGALTALPDLRRQVQALPRFVVLCGAATVLLLAASAIV